MSTIRILAVSLAAALFAGAAHGDVAVVEFDARTAPRLQLKDRMARVTDAQGAPLFVGDRRFILAYAGNPRGLIWAWDPNDRRVRITRNGDEAWIGCHDLKPVKNVCNGRAPVRGARPVPPPSPPPPPEVTPVPAPPPPAPDDGGLTEGGVGGPVATGGVGVGIGYGGAARGVPVCPGDPRCKKIKRGRP